MGSLVIPELPIRTSKDKKSRIPCIGFGTATPTLSGSEEAKEAIIEAIKLGYRHFDTASIYGIEECLGEAIAEAISSGIIGSRDELFVTSKLWPSDAHRDHVKPALQNSLKRLGLEYLDLYLIHWPISLKNPGILNIFFDKSEILPMDFKSVWEAMEECQNIGLTKSIGVSNFSCKKLEIVLATAKIPPAVNQVEMSPHWQQKKMREFCEEKGILVTAYSPLGAKGTVWGTNRVMECEVLNEIALSKGKSVAQICLRWVYEQGVSFVVKSHNKKRIKENLEIFDWKLSTEELQKISDIPQQKTCHARMVNLIHEDAPYKSEEEFWDGEI